jgi:uncharacterized protein
VKGLYLETSAIARAYLHLGGEDHATLQSAIQGADEVFTSALTGVELRRAATQLAHREGIQAAELLAAALECIAGADIVPLTDEVLARAGGAFPLPIRTLEAIHVATALEVQFRREVADLVVFSRDKRVRDIATAVGLQLI